MAAASTSAVAELAAVKETDRAVKAATKGKGRNGVGKGVHPTRKTSARKAASSAARRR